MISIIVPAYNIERYIGACLDSILAQTYRDIEVIVVNDGSNDGTGKIVDEYAAKDSRIKVIHKENAGVTKARLDGIDVATGNCVGFVDGDDTIDRDMYERLLTNMQKENADISQCGHVVERSEKEKEYFYNTGRYETMQNEEGLIALLEGIIEPGLCNKLYKMELLERMLLSGILDTSIKNYEDLLMNYILFSNATKIVYEDFCPYHYQKREGSASTGSLNMTRIWDPIRVKDIILSNCRKNDVSEKMKNAAIRGYLNTCINQYNLILSQKDECFLEELKYIQQLFLEKENEIDCLTGKRKIFAKLILKYPSLYKKIYEVYQK